MAELKRTLGFGTILALAISSILGTGLFFGPALAASIAGNASIISWILLSIFALYIAACFSELTALFPKAGGIYEFAKQTYGRFFSFMMGWVAWIAANITTSLLVVAAIEYLVPAKFPMLYKILISLVFIILLNIIAYIGLEASSITVITFTIITVGVILVILVPGFFYINSANITPLITHPLSKVFLAIFFIAETFFGFEAATYLAEETKEPEKVIPKAIMLGTSIVAFFAISLSVVLLGIFNWPVLAVSSTPFVDAAVKIFGGFGQYFTAMGVYLILIGSAATGIVSAPRLMLAMARDRLFLTQFAKIHEKFRTPYKAVIFQTIVCIFVVVLGFGKYKLLLGLIVPLGLLLYIFVLLSVPILRFKRAELKRSFKVPFGKIGPILCSIILLFIVVYWIISESQAINLIVIALSLAALGIPIYFLLEMYYNPKAIRGVSNLLANVILFTENISLPKKIREHIIHLLGDIRNKKVLDFGCSVGTLSLELAKLVGNGRVYCVDMAKHEARIAQKRMMKRGHNAVVIHDEEQTKRVHPSIPNVDAVVSVGMLSYIQDIDNVLKGLNKILKVKDKICFMEYDKFFDVIPTVIWLADDEKIKSIFHKHGFTVSIIRKQGFAWKYIFVYGVKYKDV